MKIPTIRASLRIGLILYLAHGPLQGREPDSDHDGVPDVADRCPGTSQLQKMPPNFRFGGAVNPDRLRPGPQAHPVDATGCELDNDGDGVVNSQDFCSDDSAEALSAGIAANGCPKHSDFDGTPDYRDRCPDTPREAATDSQGCPRVVRDPGSNR